MDLKRKLMEELPLTAEEALRLDSSLESSAGLSIAKAVAGLPDDAPSLEWRSRLNEKLAKASKRRKAIVFWRVGFGATAAAAVCTVFVLMAQPNVGQDSPIVSPTTVENTPKESVEDAIISEHEGTVTQASLGVSVAFHDIGP